MNITKERAGVDNMVEIAPLGGEFVFDDCKEAEDFDGDMNDHNRRIVMIMFLQKNREANPECKLITTCALATPAFRA